ncbi:MAG: heavy metal translocating P-type ATPase [Sphaerochaetaceae bacterium]
MAIQRIYTLEGIDCAGCASNIEEAVAKIEGVTSSRINLLNYKIEVVAKEPAPKDLDERIQAAIRKTDAKVTATLEEQGKTIPKPHALRWQRFIRIPVRILASLIALYFAIATTNQTLSLLLFVGAYLISGYDIVFRAVRNIFRGKVFDENFLMTVATIGAFAISQYSEAVAVMAFYQVGEYFQEIAVHRSRTSIEKLMDIKPLNATVIRDGKHVTVKPEQIVIGDILLIRPGEKIPVDAVVTEGTSLIDTKALTGESLPQVVESGDSLLSGGINGESVLQAKATRSYTDSTVATILRLVEESTMHKAQSERFITRFARYYTPIVVILASLLALIPPLFSPLPFSVWLYRALVFLVISCPCALVISVPLTFFAGIGALAKMGVLVKGSNYVQALAKTNVVVFDKTGTLTKGEFAYNGMEVLKDSSFSEETLLHYAASVEVNSTHPIAKAIVAAYSGPLKQAEAVAEVPGKGIEGIVDQYHVKVGSARYITGTDTESGILIAVDNTIMGRLHVTDSIKNESIETIKQLKALGTDSIVMLSGDAHETVSATAQSIGITEYYGQLLPQDKVAHIERLLASKQENTSLVFVGDGINDAPVLARADIGISMGSMGSDAAIEASDIVIMQDDVSRIPFAIMSSKRTLAIVKQNIIFALAVKVIIMALGALGFASMWMAVFADTGVALLAILNALRAMKQIKTKHL